MSNDSLGIIGSNFQILPNNVVNIKSPTSEHKDHTIRNAVIYTSARFFR